MAAWGSGVCVMVWTLILAALGMVALATLLPLGGSREAERIQRSEKAATPPRYSISEDADGLVLTLDPSQVTPAAAPSAPKDADPQSQGPQAKRSQAKARQAKARPTKAARAKPAGADPDRTAAPDEATDRPEGAEPRSASRGGSAAHAPEHAQSAPAAARPKADPPPRRSRPTTAAARKDRSALPKGAVGYVTGFDPARDRLSIEVRVAHLSPDAPAADLLSRISVTEAFGATDVAFDDLSCATLEASGPVWVGVERAGTLLPEAVSSAGLAPISEVTVACRIVLV